MLNLMIANCRSDGARTRLERMLNAQIHNSLDLGWKKEEIFVLSNFPYAYMGVDSIEASLNDFCLTGSKMFGVRWLMNFLADVPTIWAHDLDAWQNAPFDEPEFKDVGIAQYSNSKYNGGSVFWRRDALDIVEAICNAIVAGNLQREEPTLNGVLKSKDYKDRVTVVNNTFN